MTETEEYLDTVRLYEQEIARIPMLSAEEERALGRRIQKGDEEAADRLALANLRLADFYARKAAAHCDVPLSDLIHAGNIGVLNAARRFDPSNHREHGHQHRQQKRRHKEFQNGEACPFH